MASKKAKQIERLTAAAEARSTAERRAEIKRRKLFRAMLTAHESGELSYRDIHEITGLSEIRVAQILRAEREKRNGSE